VGQDAIHDLTAAYALNALDAHEEAEYEAHLGRCAGCRGELASFQTTAASLAYAVDAPAPSPALRDRILAQAKVERSNLIEFPRRRWLVPVASGAAAAAAVVAVSLGLWAASLSSSLDDEREARYGQERVLALMADPAAEAFPVNGAQGTLVVASGREGALVLQNLKAAPEGKIYEAWVSRDGKEMLRAATFVARGGTTVVPLSRPVPAGGLVAVTVEDEPVDEPTGKPIFTADTA